MVNKLVICFECGLQLLQKLGQSNESGGVEFETLGSAEGNESCELCNDKTLVS
jgi:hypothetical protein